MSFKRINNFSDRPVKPFLKWAGGKGQLIVYQTKGCLTYEPEI